MIAERRTGGMRKQVISGVLWMISGASAGLFIGMIARFSWALLIGNLTFKDQDMLWQARLNGLSCVCIFAAVGGMLGIGAYALEDRARRHEVGEKEIRNRESCQS